jgi:Tfp pilus assembly protein PilX
MIGYLRRSLQVQGGKMGRKTADSRGFTLIAALLLTLLMSAMAVGLIYMVNNEQRMGGNDLEGNVAYYGAEAGIENLTASLSQLYQTSQTPNAAALCALTAPAYYPTAVTGSNITAMNYTTSISWPPSNVCPTAVNPTGTWDIVGAGADQGMVATLIPFTLQVTATRQSSAGQVGTNALAATGASVNLTRTVEVALLPAFEFGVFCDGDCDYFAGPNFNFGGRIHTNGNLFLASGSSLTFTDKVAAVGEIILDQLENGHPTSSGYGGQVYIPSASGGCPPAPGSGPVSPNCNALTAGSWTGGFAPSAGTPNYPSPLPWPNISQGAPPTGFNSFVTNGFTGATKLQLPFVQSDAVGAIEIIRRPQASDSPLLSSSRLYTEAAIRILLADTEADLYPGSTRADAATQDVQIGTPYAQGALGQGYVALTQAATGNGVTLGNMYYADAKPSSGSNNWTAAAPTGCTSGTEGSVGGASLAWPNWPLFGQVTVAGKQCQGTWLRVEYWNSTTLTWTGITTEWLGFGFARGYNWPPTHPYSTNTGTVPYCANFPNYPTVACQNPISPAILILQQLQEAKGPANATAGTGDTTNSTGTANNWLPINFYDSREGEPRDSRPSDVAPPNSDCSPNGIMNAVELDVGNLWLWLQASGPYAAGSGPKVATTNQNGTVENGYILYFMDHRGMIPDAHPFPSITFYNGFSGMSGLNDVVNSTSSVGVPNGTLEPLTYYAAATPTPFSPEDTAVKGTAILGTAVDNWGQANLGAGFGISAVNMNKPYYIPGSVTGNLIQCYSGSTSGVPAYGTATAEWNMVTGPRHVLRLVDGGMDTAGNSFVPPTGATVLPNGQAVPGIGGFTVASEEPVYVYGNYNTGPADLFWPSENTTTNPHSAAAIIADAVTLLSNPPMNNAALQVPTNKIGWFDLESFLYPQQAVKSGSNPGRQGNTSYYRVAIAAGKSIPFPQPAWGAQDFGTDGGMHNFLRYLEDRSDGGNGGGGQVNYAGSMISMYYSQYATGVFKCCNSTYAAPLRNYFFDTQLLNPNNLPPGTPEFQDVVSLGFHQSFTPQ